MLALNTGKNQRRVVRRERREEKRREEKRREEKRNKDSERGTQRTGPLHAM